MPDLDQVLAPLLDHPLAEPEPMANLERRAGRVRRTRRLRLAGAAAAAAAAIVVVFALGGGDDGQLVRTIPPANDPQLAPPPPGAIPGPPASHEPPLRHITRLGGITVDGDTWDIMAGPGDDGFCFGLQFGSSVGASCGGPILEPGEVFGVSPAEDLQVRPAGEPLPAWVQENRPPFVYGPVAKEVATIRLQLQDGTTVDVAPTGAEAGLPFNVYAVAIPPGAVPESMVALGPDGGELARRGQPLWPPAPPAPCLSVADASVPCAPADSGSGPSAVGPSAVEERVPPITPPTMAPG